MSTQKVIVITGASDGIGAAAARALSRQGHQIVVVGRSPTKTKRVADELQVDSYVADYSDLHSVRRLASDLLSAYPRIDVLANNAGGVFGKPREVTDDGHEVTFQVNYLAPFVLTQLLLDRLIESRATVISTSSVGHRLGRLDLSNLDGERRYSPIAAYSTAKLEQILFAKELDRRYGELGLASVAFHPGNINSNFSQQDNAALRWIVRNPLVRLTLLSPEQGADTMVYLAQSQAGVDFPSGGYFVKRKVARPSRQARDADLAARLWERTEQIVNDI